ncbi:MAG: hypothetical protein ACHP7K_09330 [Actinomycetales bacterium]
MKYINSYFPSMTDTCPSEQASPCGMDWPARTAGYDRRADPGGWNGPDLDGGQLESRAS